MSEEVEVLESTTFDKNVYGAIRVIAEGQQHCGLVVRDDENKLMLVHLAWHYDLRTEVFDGRYLCLDVGLDPYSQTIVAAFCLLVAEQCAKKVPYAFEFRNLMFVPETGDIVGLAKGEGMTCASFVYTIFKSLGFEPLQLIDWPEREDDEIWRSGITAAIARLTGDNAHADSIDISKPHIRIRPEEIIAAISRDSTEWPGHHEEVQPVAKQIMLRLAA